VECRCDSVTELYGDEAAAYADEHLRAGPAVDELVCPDTGTRWRLDEKDPEQPRLVAAGP
jgi:hypothetical protein